MIEPVFWSLGQALAWIKWRRPEALAYATPLQAEMRMYLAGFRHVVTGKPALAMLEAALQGGSIRAIGADGRTVPTTAWARIWLGFTPEGDPRLFLKGNRKVSLDNPPASIVPDAPVILAAAIKAAWPGPPLLPALVHHAELGPFLLDFFGAHLDLDRTSHPTIYEHARDWHGQSINPRPSIDALAADLADKAGAGVFEIWIESTAGLRDRDGRIPRNFDSRARRLIETFKRDGEPIASHEIAAKLMRRPDDLAHAVAVAQSVRVSPEAFWRWQTSEGGRAWSAENRLSGWDRSPVSPGDTAPASGYELLWTLAEKMAGPGADAATIERHWLAIINGIWSGALAVPEIVRLYHHPTTQARLRQAWTVAEFGADVLDRAGEAGAPVSHLDGRPMAFYVSPDPDKPSKQQVVPRHDRETGKEVMRGHFDRDRHGLVGLAIRRADFEAWRRPKAAEPPTAPDSVETAEPVAAGVPIATSAEPASPDDDEPAGRPRYTQGALDAWVRDTIAARLAEGKGRPKKGARGLERMARAYFKHAISREWFDAAWKKHAPASWQKRGRPSYS